MPHRKHIIKHYRIESKKRLAGSRSKSDFKYTIVLPRGDHLKVICESAVIPKSWFNLSKNNTLTLTDDGTPITITVPLGNYNIINMASELASLLTAGSLAEGNGRTYTVDYSLITGKLSFSANAGTNTITSNALDTDLNELLGLDASTVYTMPFTSANICRYNAHDNLTLHSDIVSSQDDNVLANISVGHVASFEYINYRYQSENLDSKHLLRKGDEYEFYLTNDLGRIVDLNGLDWSMDLVVFDDTISEQLHHFAMIEEFINYSIERAEEREQGDALKKTKPSKDEAKSQS